MKMRCRSWLVVFLLSGTLLAVPALAQEQTGSIEGTIRDSSGGVLPGVTVEVRSPALVGVSSVVTDSTGVYRFPALPPGRYSVNATLPGFTSGVVENVTLSLGQILKIDLALAVAGLTETVQVTAESPLIDVRQNATFATLTADVIERIPKGRDFTAVVGMAPGANIEDRAGGISVSGASGGENRFIVDGVDTTNLRTGASGKAVVTDFIQEVQVKTSGYNAEFPGATGGVVNAVTKSGSNLFRGSSGFYFTNNESLKGEQRPLVRLDPRDTTKVQFYKVPLDKNPEWHPVFELGGPIMRDRLWFYGGWAPIRETITRTVTFRTAPASGDSPTQTFEQKQPVDRVYTNLSWQVASSLRAKFSYAPTWGRVRGSRPSIEAFTAAESKDGPWSDYDSRSTANPNTDYRSSGNNTWNDAYSGLVDWVVNSGWYVSVSGGYFMTNSETLGAGTVIERVMNDNIGVFAGDPGLTPDLIQPSGYSDGKSSSRTVRDVYTRTYVNATSTWFKNWIGQHSIKAGVRFERIGNDRYTGRTEPRIDFYWNREFVAATGERTRGQYGYYAVSRGVIGTGDIHSNNWGFFVQDGWSPTSRLTINAGVRTESERVPFYTAGEEHDGIKFPFSKKIAPRIGFAYDVKGDGKWKTFGSFGRYYDITKLEMPMGSLGGQQWRIYYYPLDTLNWKGISCQENDPACPGSLLEVRTLRFGSNEINNPTTMVLTQKYFGAPRNMLMDDMDPMSSNEYVFGVDHELNRVTSVGVRYTHNAVGKVIEDFGWNEGGTEYYFIGNPGDGYIGGLEFLWGKLYDPALAGGAPRYQVKPKRVYDAIEFNFTKRLAQRWSGQASYTYSRLYGNYPGLSSSDEAGSGTARMSPNVNRLYDGPWMMYDTQGNEVLGRLNNDRPHYVKLQGTYDLPWGTTVGVQWYGRSGALFSKYITYQGYSWVFYDGRGSLGRSPMEQNTSLALNHEFRLPGRRTRLSLNANISNLFDNDVATSIYALQYRDSFVLNPIESFFVPWDPNTVAAGLGTTRMRPDPRYGLQNLFMGRRDIRVGMKITF
jgi:hypothetical protein